MHKASSNKVEDTCQSSRLTLGLEKKGVEVFIYAVNSPIAFNLVSGMEQRCEGTHLAPGVPLSQSFSILFLCLPMRMLTIPLYHLWFQCKNRDLPG